MVNFPGHGRAYAEYVAAPADQLARGRIRAHVSQIFSFAQLPDALRTVEAGKAQGKVIVVL